MSIVYIHSCYEKTSPVKGRAIFFNWRKKVSKTTKSWIQKITENLNGYTTTRMKWECGCWTICSYKKINSKIAYYCESKT